MTAALQPEVAGIPGLAPTGPASLRVRDLRKTFVSHLLGGAARRVLDDVDLDVHAGGCVVVTGPSGSGKSSLLRCIYRTYLPDQGSVDVRWPTTARPFEVEVDLATADDRTVLAARRHVVALATQFLSVTPRIAAVDLVAQEIGTGDPSSGRYAIDRADAAERLQRLGLSAELIEAPPATFSGGERQMVNLAIALARPRPLILLDEVTASLDPQRRRLALGAIVEHKQAGATVLAVFHDVPDVRGLVDAVVRMEAGTVVPA